MDMVKWFREKNLLHKYQALPLQLKASVWFFVCVFMQRGISILTTPVFTRLLTTYEYGQYSVFNSWLGILTVCITMNIPTGVYQQGLVKFEKERNIYSSSLQGLVLSLAAFSAVIYLAFYKFWNSLFSLTTIQMLSMLLLVWTSAVFNFWASDQRIDYKYRALLLITVVVSLAKPVTGILFVLCAKDKVTARILGLVLVELAGYTALFFIQMKKGKTFFSSQYWKYALLLHLPLIPHYLSQNVLSNADRIMISRMAGDDQAGIYSLAYSISQIMALFNVAMEQTITPWILRKIKSRKITEIADITYITVGFIAVLNLLLIIAAPEIVAVFAPEKYRDAIWIIPPVAMSVYFMYLYAIFAKFEFYFEKTKYIMGASVVGALTNIGLNYIFIKKYGYFAAGYTTLVCYMLYVLCHYLAMQKVCRMYLDGIMPYDAKVLIRISVLFLLAGFAFLATYNYTEIRYALIAALLCLLFLFRKKITRLAVRLLESTRS